jgi:predicted metal-dependent hydrolase
MIDYHFVSSSRAKRISITISQGQVKVTVPKGVNFEAAKPFIQSKQTWILKHIQKYQDFLAQQSKKNSVEQNSKTEQNRFLYLGQTYPLKIVKVNNPLMEIDFGGEGLLALMPKSIPQAEWPQVIAKQMLKWYKEQARTIFTEKLQYYAELMGLRYNQLRIKEQKTKWGSCSGRKNINLNWRVIMAPSEVINYLIIHELAHLRFMNHSPEFWQLVASYLPEYSYWRKWLREHGEELNAWGDNRERLSPA